MDPERRHPSTFTVNGGIYTSFYVNNQLMFYKHTYNNEYIRNLSVKNLLKSQPSYNLHLAKAIMANSKYEEGQIVESTKIASKDRPYKYTINNKTYTRFFTCGEEMIYEHEEQTSVNQPDQTLNNLGSSKHSNDKQQLIHSAHNIARGEIVKSSPADTVSKMPPYKHKNRPVRTSVNNSNKNKKLNNVVSPRHLQLTELERTKYKNSEEIIANNEPNISKSSGHDSKAARSYIIAPPKGTTSSAVDGVTPEIHATNITSNCLTFKCSGQGVTATNSENNNVTISSGVKDIAPDNRRGYSSGYDVPAIQTFRPTWEEFKDFNAYIKAIEKTGAHKAGVCKIIPPPEWVPRKSGYDVKKMKITIPRPIEQVAQGKNGLYIQHSAQKKKISLQAFQELTKSEQYRTPPHKDFADLERVYWENITKVVPIYGADVSASITDPECTAWNMNHLDTVLDYLKKDSDISIEGVNSVYLYFGMWKSTFAWHTEDMDLYSINYLHFGAPKTWYSIPTNHARRFEEFAAKCFSEDKKICPGFLRHKSTLISPSVLKLNKIPFDIITQEAGEIMITFPLGYHAGFNHGFNCAESTNFATERWIDYGKHVVKCTCRQYAVNIDMDKFVKRFQPEQYDSWLKEKNDSHSEVPFTGSGIATADARTKNKKQRRKRVNRKRKSNFDREFPPKVSKKKKPNNSNNESSSNLNYISNYPSNEKDSQGSRKKCTRKQQQDPTVPAKVNGFNFFVDAQEKTNSFGVTGL